MSDIDTIREALKQAEKIIGKQPGLTSSALAALDRLQAQQPNAEPVAKAIAMVDDFRWAHEHAMELATATHGPMPEGYDDDDEPDTPWHCFTSAHRAHRTHPPASTEHPSYVYSRDYEALYDLLMRGGEAIVIEQWPNGEQARRLNRRYLFGRSDAEPDTTKEFAINLWRRLDLEWIAPSTEPRLTVEQAMEVVEPFIDAEAEMEDGARWNWESKHKKYREMIEEIRDRFTKAAKP